MKKKYIYSLVFAIGLSACQEAKSTQENNSLENKVTEQIDSVQTISVEPVEEVTIDFSKFEQYATILSKEDLIAQFGKNNIEDRTAWYAEGTVERQSSILTNPNNGHIIKYIWAEEDNTTTSWIEANYYKWDENFEIQGTQTIETENGLKLGMSLTDLKKWNGADFRFSGFGWDYQGGVFADEGSKLANSKVLVTLINNQENQSEDWNFILGDVELNTADERLKNAPILVEQFVLHTNLKNEK